LKTSKDFSGVFTALVTPFKNGEVDYASLAKILRQQLDGKVSGLVVNGTTAESPTLSETEVSQIFNFVKSETAGQVPLVMGTGSNSTAATVKATKKAQDLGADAALVVVPYYNKPPQRGLFQHYQQVAACSELPIILYNVPGRTITKLELETIIELSHLPSIIGIKEATGDIEFGHEIAKNCEPGFLLTSGDDGTFLNLVRVGGQGVISVASNLLPAKFSDWCARARHGDSAPQDEFTRFNDLNNHFYVEANPIPIKAALYLCGIIASPELRLPLVTLSEPHMAAMKTKLQALELL
jgi:4-hydroxy-tetrahydrodipicolinate synthase